ncbi:MAG: alpha/beta fold hydrolase [Prosthecobacter sp.]
MVIYLHGGGWATGSKQHIAVGAFSDVCLKLLERGFAVAAVNYRLCKPGGSVAVRDCVTDVKDAVRHLSKHGDKLGLDLERCVVHGDSAGGHLAQMLLLSPRSDFPGDPSLAEQPYRMIAGVSWYGPCDFQQIELFDSGEGGEVRDRFGARNVKPGTAPKDVPGLYREISPVQYLRADSPPLLMIQGDQDTAIPAKHAFHMQEKAAAVRAPVEFLIIKNAGHNWREVGGPIEPRIDEIVARTVQFIVDRVAAPR